MSRLFLWTGLNGAIGFALFYVLFVTRTPNEPSDLLLAGVLSIAAAMPVVIIGLSAAAAVEEIEKKRREMFWRQIVAQQLAMPDQQSTQFKPERN